MSNQNSKLSSHETNSASFFGSPPSFALPSTISFSSVVWRRITSLNAARVVVSEASGLSMSLPFE